MGFEPATDNEVTHSEEELRMLISESYKSGQINQSEQELLQNVFRFEKRIAEEIMVPRPEVWYLDTDNSLEENLRIARKAGHTRFPLCKGSPDQVIGLVNIKDILLNDQVTKIYDLKRDILFIPEGMPLDQLLQEFQTSRIHMAVIMDEYGGTAGIVTMEDVLEELVGEIQDEFDHEEPPIVAEGNNRFLVSGRMFIDDAMERFDIPLNEENEQYNTLAGYILGKLGRRPREGDIINLNNLCLEVVGMKGLRIDKIRVHTNTNHPTDS